MSKHTPGPWHLNQRVIEYTPAGISELTELIAYVYDQTDNALDDATNAANARLLVAAPDLFEACRAAAAYFERIGQPEETPTFTALREALKKAEGK